MLNIYKHLVFVFFIYCLSPLVLAAEDPYIFVTKATDQLLLKLAEVRPLYDTDKPKFFKALDESLSAFVDFDGFSKSVMGKYYSRATAEQRATFVCIFRTSLIETYAKALVTFDNQKIEIMKPTPKDNKANKSIITLKIHGKGGVIYHVVYTLRLVDDAWKLRNLHIEGFNLGLQFRSQFMAKMRKNNRNIDDTIHNWLVHE